MNIFPNIFFFYSYSTIPGQKNPKNLKNTYLHNKIFLSYKKYGMTNITLFSNQNVLAHLGFKMKIQFHHMKRLDACKFWRISFDFPYD